MTSDATNSSMQIVRRGCPFFVEQRLTYFDQAIDLGAREPAAARKFQKAEVGRIFERTIITAPEEVAQRDLERL